MRCEAQRLKLTIKHSLHNVRSYVGGTPIHNKGAGGSGGGSGIVLCRVWYHFCSCAGVAAFAQDIVHIVAEFWGVIWDIALAIEYQEVQNRRFKRR